MKIILIINPAAGNGQAMRLFADIEPVCVQENIEYWVTKAPFEASGRIREWCLQHPDELVLFAGMGGDGTMHELINGAAGFENAHITCLPAGSGNDFARHFGSFPCTKETMYLLKQSVKNVELHDRIYFEGPKTGSFVNNMGVGFDAAVAHSSNRSALKKWLNRFKAGRLVYVFYLLRHLFTYRPGDFQIEIDGKTNSWQKVWFITLANQPFYGGGMKIAPNADSQDGILDIIVVHHLSKLKFLALFISVFWGGHLRFKEVDVIRGKKVEVWSGNHVLIHADGEEAGLMSENAGIQVEVCQKNWRLVKLERTKVLTNDPPKR
ncbi:diacylglycerol kinase family lipid kinase [Jeotgalibacillus sp. S-D1]|uniref:diacylglycerol/lipid kinase family protein n=1 Tax=Jeotgalibacillus sp. S-D1 TaxID=2552189 RepID=UPI00105A02CA|nr:diacylglycerol kinase family protein [Jeotgalibacillus sp. S-D1]TDL34248.1 diacylglycerol kinase family lipid kinase [Jeotgalibacillus sp. S-D1]